jgi:hypothetical protein
LRTFVVVNSPQTKIYPKERRWRREKWERIRGERKGGFIREGKRVNLIYISYHNIIHIFYGDEQQCLVFGFVGWAQGRALWNVFCCWNLRGNSLQVQRAKLEQWIRVRARLWWWWVGAIHLI